MNPNPVETRLPVEGSVWRSGVWRQFVYRGSHSTPLTQGYDVGSQNDLILQSPEDEAL